MLATAIVAAHSQAVPAWGASPADAATPAAGQPAAAPAATPASCLSSGDGYLRAHLAGAIDTEIDWPNSGTRCEGAARRDPRGVRLTFARPGGSSPDLLFVFGITGVQEGESAHALGVNLTVIVQGTSEIFGTLGDSRCTIDALTQRRLGTGDAYRLEARGFCTQPAHAVHGGGTLLVSRFDFAGIVSYPRDDDAS
ncbi:MAG: hypothetical protein ACHQIL_00495 [Steroidobacterales bacterium]